MRLVDKLAWKAIEYIHENIKNKIDYEGNPLVPYSFGYWILKKRKKTSAKTKKGKEMFLERMRSEWQSDKKNVDLVRFNHMLAAMTVFSKDDETADIGFTNMEDALKAFYHNISGAGKSRVLRKFLGITDSQRAALESMMLEEMTPDDAWQLMKKFLMQIKTPS